MSEPKAKLTADEIVGLLVERLAHHEQEARSASHRRDHLHGLRHAGAREELTHLLKEITA